MNDDQIIDIINILLEKNNTTKIGNRKYNKFYYIFFYDHSTATSDSNLRLKMLETFTIFAL